MREKNIGYFALPYIYFEKIMADAQTHVFVFILLQYSLKFTLLADSASALHTRQVSSVVYISF